MHTLFRQSAAAIAAILIVTVTWIPVVTVPADPAFASAPLVA